MSETKKRYVDLTPTWAAVMPIHFAAIEYGTETGKAAAKGELMRLATWADGIMAEHAQFMCECCGKRFPPELKREHMDEGMEGWDVCPECKAELDGQEVTA